MVHRAGQTGKLSEGDVVLCYAFTLPAVLGRIVKLRAGREIRVRYDWANELSLLSADILGQLAARGLSVRELRFAVGPITRRRAGRVAGPVRRAAPANAPLPPKLRRSITAIDDGDLSRALAGAAARGLALNDGKR